MDEFLIKLILVFITAAASIGGTLLIERLKNRVLILRKKISYQLIGLSRQNEIWGDIQVTVDGNVIHELYLYNVEIANNTTKDAPKNMVITFSLDSGNYFLQEQGKVENDDVTLGLQYEAEYDKMAKEVYEAWHNQSVMQQNDTSPIWKEYNITITHKKFVIPVLNRKKRAFFEFLIAKNTVDTPQLAIGIYEPGVSLSWHESPKNLMEKSIARTIIVALIGLILIFPIAKYSPSTNWAIILMVVNSMISYFIANIFIRIWAYIKKLS